MMNKAWVDPRLAVLQQAGQVPTSSTFPVELRGRRHGAHLDGALTARGSDARHPP